MQGRACARSVLLACMAAVCAMPCAAQSAGHFADIGQIACAEGAERYLPGEYYFCAANKALQAGHAGKARAMYEESARWGDKRAMFNLGLLLFRGDTLPKDAPLGLAWLALAAERQQDREHRDVLVAAWTAATPQEQASANALWNTMKLEYADRVALQRAQLRYERESRLLRRDLERDPTLEVQIAGMGPPAQGVRLLQTLDEAAADTILRPLPVPKGKVNVGELEVVRNEAPAKP